MTEAGLLPLEKRKKKATKRHLEEVPAAQEPAIQEIDSSKIHKHKKKKNSKETEKDEETPAEIQTEHTGEARKKKKRKHGAENASVDVVVKEESEDYVAPQEGEVEVKKKKKKKKKTDEETPSAGGSSQAEETLTQVQMDSQKVIQKPVKKTSKKAKNTADGSRREEDDDDDDEELGEELLDVDDAVRAEILEFLPHYKFNDEAFMRKTARYDLPRFREFKNKGIPIRLGKFSASENVRLKKNVKDFLALSGIASEFHLFRPHRFPEERSDILRRRRQFKFVLRVCEGVPHPWQTILSRARKMCNRENYKGRFTEDENNTLKRLHTLHGSDWATISNKMGRSNSALQKRMSMMTNTHGPWSEVEFKGLLTNVREQLIKRAKPGTDGSLVVQKMDLYKKLSWMAVVEELGGRTWLQCREKWMDYLTRKMTTGGRIRGRKSLEGQIQLIKLVNEMVVEDSCDIVWDDLTHLFGNAPPDYLQMRLYQLKLTYVPGWKTMPFCDIIDFLFEKTLPELEKELETCEEEEEPAETRQFYKLSEIFPDL